MSSEQLRIARRKAREIGIGRFRTIADVTCDIEVCGLPVSPRNSDSLSLFVIPQGGLEFVTRSTTISDPFYYTNPTPGERDGIQIMSIDILPTELPFDSSMSFSQALMPYLRGLISEYRSEPSSKFQKEKEALERATIAWDGKLVGPHQWLYEPLRDLGKETKEKGPETVGVRRKKRILMLGSGMVAGPAAAQFLQRSDVELVVGQFIPVAYPILRFADSSRRF
jgi:alpha-aminoadipic semialdehyde synthase